MYLEILSVILGVVVAVTGQDPTAACYPPVFQTEYYNLITEDRGFIYVDFSKQKFVEVSSVSSNKYIHDFAKLQSYAISGSGNHTTCKNYTLQQSQVMYRCLPPYAKYVTHGSGYLHHVASEKMLLHTWDVETETDKVNRVVFSVVGGQPNWPIMSQEYGYHGTTNMYIYLNPTPTVSNQSVFTIPTSCQTYEINISPIIG
ncbi:unnamed protein product [Candidula unifasciata]|uniref:Uncharacterized protein n=1 Tax=Candidula unifasciata TaxID=100452 RepID=A0A8S4A168_9EUPU|nr:unnamed protein product [Candidula unifasciata]